VTIPNQFRATKLDTRRHRARDDSTRHRPLPTYWRSFGTKPLSPAVFDILASNIGVRTLTFHGHVTSSVTWPFDSQVPISYRCSIVTKSLSPAIFEIMGTKHIGSRPWSFRVTWRHRSRDHLTPRWPFPIGAPLSPNRYLQLFPRQWTPSILGSRPWPFRATWRHRSRDHWTPDGSFPIGGPLDPSLYL